jgi:hypothetical protein
MYLTAYSRACCAYKNIEKLYTYCFTKEGRVALKNAKILSLNIFGSSHGCGGKNVQI